MSTIQFLLTFFHNSIEKIPDMPPIESSNKIFSSHIFHEVLLGSTANLLFFSKIGLEKRSQILDYIEDLLFSEKVEYRLIFENRTMELFVTICKMITMTKQKEQERFWEIAEKIILTHEANPFLQDKIQYIFYLSQTSNCEFLVQKYE